MGQKEKRQNMSWTVAGCWGVEDGDLRVDLREAAYAKKKKLGLHFPRQNRGGTTLSKKDTKGMYPEENEGKKIMSMYSHRGSGTVLCAHRDRKQYHHAHVKKKCVGGILDRWSERRATVSRSKRGPERGGGN